MICIGCKKDTAGKVIYAGMPVKFCFDEECAVLWGFWSYPMLLLPFDGWFFAYEGNYFIALYHWLRHGFCPEDEEL